MASDESTLEATAERLRAMVEDMEARLEEEYSSKRARILKVVKDRLSSIERILENKRAAGEDDQDRDNDDGNPRFRPNGPNDGRGRPSGNKERLIFTR
ncbi:MAG: hypothetical protein ACOYJ2_08945 [Rickettsiales bacterium]